ncbi:MAG: VWA domain-containing protein, partial [Proteobacteria bacterium]|nr:VWA domain-containing protein [Pseudomonadota bacterium]
FLNFSLGIGVLGFAFVACKSANFSGGNNSSNGNKQPASTGNCVPSATQKCPPTSNSNTTSTTATTTTSTTKKPDDLSGLSTDNGGLCLTSAPNIDFVFAMDVSGSMQPESNKVMAAFSSLTQSLQNLTIPDLGKPRQVRYGLVTFEDQIVFESPLSADFNQTAQLINQNFRAVERFSDPTEGGLFAVGRAAEIANDGGPSIKIIFLVTDAFAHDGSGGSGLFAKRSFSTQKIEQALRSANMKMTFIYTATSFNRGEGSGPTKNAVDQWRAIRATAAQIGAHGQLGRDFDIASYSANDISASIPADLGANLHKCK